MWNIKRFIVSDSSLIHHSKHLFRLQPLYNISQALLNYCLTVSVNGNIANFTGPYGNHASFLTIEESYTELNILSQSIVCVSELPEREEILHHPRTIPLIWMPWDSMIMHIYMQPPELPESQLFELADYAMSFVKRNNYDLIKVLTDINLTIYREYLYQPGSSTFSTTPYQTYVSRKGVCQHFAELFICMARLLNIPARYRTGYIYTGGNYLNKLQSDASHAWVEVFVPYMGWLGFDPTNGCMAEKNHIKVACGRFYADATPTSGVIFAEGFNLKEELYTSVNVMLLNK